MQGDHSKSANEELEATLDDLTGQQVDAGRDETGSPETPEEVVEMLEQQLSDLRDRELKAQAELENFRKRMIRDTEQTIKYAAVPLVCDILEVVDNMNRATEIAQSTNESSSLLEGVKMVQQQLVSVLEKHHCKPIDALGKAFDPNLHQAISQSPSSEYAAGIVSLEASKGYKMHDRVIRPSHVIVSTGPA